MRLLVTGAAGFIGRAVSKRLSRMDGIDNVRLIDRHLPDEVASFESHQIDLLDPEQLRFAIDGVTSVIHLASLAGGTSEIDPAASRQVNLEASLNLIEAIVNSRNPVRFVYTSSIAVFGELPPQGVDDTTRPFPRMTYGTHKLMVEYAIADSTRRSVLDGIAIRLPGIVARPSGDKSLKSAFVSEIFWAIVAGYSYEVPVPPSATLWLQSLDACVTAILHATSVSIPVKLPSGITLPALRVTIAELVEAIGAATRRATDHITYRADPVITANFGSYPPLTTEAADRLGFRHDGDLEHLVNRALECLHL